MAIRTPALVIVLSALAVSGWTEPTSACEFRAVFSSFGEGETIRLVVTWRRLSRSGGLQVDMPWEVLPGKRHFPPMYVVEKDGQRLTTVEPDGEEHFSRAGGAPGAGALTFDLDLAELAEIPAASVGRYVVRLRDHLRAPDRQETPATFAVVPRADLPAGLPPELAALRLYALGTVSAEAAWAAVGAGRISAIAADPNLELGYRLAAIELRLTDLRDRRAFDDPFWEAVAKDTEPVVRWQVLAAAGDLPLGLLRGLAMDPEVGIPFRVLHACHRAGRKDPATCAMLHETLRFSPDRRCAFFVATHFSPDQKDDARPPARNPRR